MKPRKSTETDAEYIARLEAANADLRRSNTGHAKFHNYCVTVLRVAGARLGLMFDYAAELCEMQGSEEHIAIKRELDKFGSLPWDRDPGEINIPKRLNWKVTRPDPPSDAGMILKSALEILKAQTPPWDPRIVDLFPDRLEEIAEWDWLTVKSEIYDALSDLEMGRGLLRDDLRSAMYDHCFSRIVRAVSEAERMSDRPEPESVPF